jgi:lysophospholipase L1-like esterase
MPVYVKKDNKWQIVASSYNEPSPTLFNNVNGEWRETRSGWVNVKGEWQKFYQKTPMVKNKLKNFVFLGDSLSYGTGLPVSQQFTTLIQNHFNGIDNNGNNNVVRSLMVDDRSTTGGENRFITSSGVKYTNTGIFSPVYDDKRIRNTAITIPAGEYIDIPVNKANGKLFNISVSGKNFVGEISSVWLTWQFGTRGYFENLILHETIDSNITTHGNVYYGNPLYANFWGGDTENFYDYSIDFDSKATYVRIKVTSGELRINSVHSMSNFPLYASEKNVGIVQVIARDGYTFEDFLNVPRQEIRNNILYKQYYDDNTNSNATPVLIVQAGLMDIVKLGRNALDFFQYLEYGILLHHTPTNDIVYGGYSTDSNSTSITAYDIVLTIPHPPSQLSPYFKIYNENIKAISDVFHLMANRHNLDVVDLSTLDMGIDCYQLTLDRINPNYKGSVKIANKYIEDLGLASFQNNSSQEYLLPARGL